MASDKATRKARAANAERRAHRRKDGHPRRGRAVPSPRGILEALAAVDLDAPWHRVAPHILPILKRAHPPLALASPVYVTVPPGIRTGFGIDLGPAFTHVDTAMVERWGVSTTTLLVTALDNLRTVIDREPPIVERIEPDGVPVIVVQGQGWGSSLVLLPDALVPLIGSEPRLLIAPVRNTLVAVPDAAPEDFVEDLYLAIAGGAPDALDPRVLRWTGRAVVDLADRSVGWPN